MNTKPQYFGHRKRLKARYLQSGLKGFLDYEALEFLLFFVIPRKDCKSIAKLLISRFGSFSGVIDANPSDLEKINGIGPQASLFLTVLKDFSSFYLQCNLSKGKFIPSSRKAREYISLKLKSLEKEIFLVLFLNSENEIIVEKILSEGTVDQAVIYPREIVKEALKCKASRVICAHNHLGNSSKPSKDDTEITRVLYKSLSLVSITLLDHLVVGRNDIFSFAESGQLETLQEEQVIVRK
ncbi:MAG: DNA repair protein RadC [bacterium]